MRVMLPCGLVGLEVFVSSVPASASAQLESVLSELGSRAMTLNHWAVHWPGGHCATGDVTLDREGAHPA